MAIGLIGKKLGMMRIMQEHGVSVSVTAIEIQENRIVQTKTVETDGYSALQITTGQKINKKGEAKHRRVSGAIKGHYAKAKQNIGLGLWEFRVDESELETLSQNPIDLSILSEGQFVDVIGQSKGKGYQGGVKRHNFQMQDATHGNSISHRAIGSTGQCQNPGRVFKGKKMAGHMGDEQVTQENLKIIKIDEKRCVLLVQGAIPGAKQGFVRVSLSHKKSKQNAAVSAN